MTFYQYQNNQNMFLIALKNKALNQVTNSVTTISQSLVPEND